MPNWDATVKLFYKRKKSGFSTCYNFMIKCLSTFKFFFNVSNWYLKLRKQPNLLMRKKTELSLGKKFSHHNRPPDFLGTTTDFQDTLPVARKKTKREKNKKTPKPLWP